MPTSFGITANVFINNLQNPALKYDEIESGIESLYDLIVNGTLTFPTLDTEYLELLDENYILKCEDFDKLSETIYQDSKPLKVGYSPVKIISSPLASDQKIEEVDNYFQPINNSLSKIFRRLNKSLRDHKLLLYLFNNLEVELINEMDLTKFKFTTNSFGNIFRKTIFNDENSTLNSEDILAIPYIMYYILLYKLFLRSYDYPSNMLLQIYDDEILTPNDIVNDFDSYIDDYSLEVSEGVTEYLLNNIFLFGQNVSDNIVDSTVVVVNSMMSDFSNLFNEVKDDIIPGDVTFTLAYDVLSQVVSETAITCLNGIGDTTSYSQSFYEASPFIMGVDPYEFARLEFDEDKILQNVITYMNDNIDQISDLKIISSQYRDVPLYFLNSYVLNFSRYNLGLIQDFDAFTLTDVKNWLHTFYIDNDTTVNALYEYLSKNKLIFERQYSKSLLLASFLKFKEIIDNFCEHDKFKDYIIETFIPRIYQHIRSRFYINIDWYNYVDNICNFFKLIFYKHLLEVGIDDRYKLFGNYLHDFSQLTYAYFENNNYIMSNVSIQSILRSEIGNNKQYYYILNSFFKSSVTSRYLQNTLQKYYAL